MEKTLLKIMNEEVSMEELNSIACLLNKKLVGNTYRLGDLIELDFIYGAKNPQTVINARALNFGETVVDGTPYYIYAMFDIEEPDGEIVSDLNDIYVTIKFVGYREVME